MVHLFYLWRCLQLVEIETDSSGSAVGSINDGFGGFSETLRGWLNGLRDIDIAFQETIRFLKGTFLGDWS